MLDYPSDNISVFAAEYFYVIFQQSSLLCCLQETVKSYNLHGFFSFLTVGAACTVFLLMQLVSLPLL